MTWGPVPVYSRYVMTLDGQHYLVYLVVAPFCELAPSVRVLLRTLDKLVPYLPVVEGFYRNDTDEALLGLYFERDAVDLVGVDALVEVVRRCHLPVIVPDRLTPDKHTDFVQRHLSTYHTYVQQYRAPEAKPSLLERLLMALEEHIDGTNMADWEHPSVEASSAIVRAHSNGERATSAWETEVSLESAEFDPDALA
jgi:hypothetical protein